MGFFELLIYLVVGILIREGVEYIRGQYHHRSYVRWKTDMVKRGLLE